jgi:rubredoxin
MSTTNRLAALEAAVARVRCPVCGRGSADGGMMDELRLATDGELDSIIAFYERLDERRKCPACRPERPCGVHGESIEVRRAERE